MTKIQLRQYIREVIELDIEKGDTVYGGKWRNKKMVVKDIGKDETGEPTINDKQILKFRTHKKEKKESDDKGDEN